MKRTERYKTPPKKVFRAMGLGVIEHGYIKCVAGFRFNWWDPIGVITPLIVRARVLRVKT